jgi:hypothetical protein
VRERLQQCVGPGGHEQQREPGAGTGHALPLTITVPVEAAESAVLGISTQYGHPTGVVYNATSDFKISENGVKAPATLIFDTLDGIICGWNPVVDPTHAIVLYDALADNNAPAVYTSLEIAQSGGKMSCMRPTSSTTNWALSVQSKLQMAP